eukprot:TRINITY_DN38_c0_g1_i1.p1 TRINITY_DN38_c0_g1~~TRINITY_DN38_c0_g1_i1.p1  ORF type:complete len:450 (-),score=217.46 TRINITY_DN38_c0_g1_i1:73-1422(-)
MSRVVRQSKYRHVFGTGSKKEQCYDNLTPSRSAWDSNKVKANNKYVGLILEARGGGAFAVFPNQKLGKYTADLPRFTGHKGEVLDIDFSPFNDGIVASVSEDGNGRIWSIPAGGPTQSVAAPTQQLIGHKRKVGTADFHPTAENILATTSTDFTVKIWDIENGAAALTVPGHSDIIQSLAWSRNGSRVVTTCKDKKIRLLDPRTQSIAAETAGHQGVKGSRATWLGDKGTIFTVGFTKTSDRAYAIYDPRNFAAPVAKQNIDTSSGLLMPFYDNDTSLLFVGGKGDGNIRYYEVVDDAPYLHYVADYKSAVPQLGLCLRPKTAVDVSICEVASILKVADSYVEPISFQVPRKSELFQDDIFPPTAGPDAALTAAEYLGGRDADPILVNLEGGFVARERPEFKPSVVVEEKAELTEAELRTEYEKLTRRVAFLEAELVKRDARIAELESK